MVRYPYPPRLLFPPYRPPAQICEPDFGTSTDRSWGMCDLSQPTHPPSRSFLHPPLLLFLGSRHSQSCLFLGSPSAPCNTAPFVRGTNWLLLKELQSPLLFQAPFGVSTKLRDLHALCEEGFHPLEGFQGSVKEKKKKSLKSIDLKRHKAETCWELTGAVRGGCKEKGEGFWLCPHSAAPPYLGSDPS